MLYIGGGNMQLIRNNYFIMILLANFALSYKIINGKKYVTGIYKKIGNIFDL